MERQDVQRQKTQSTESEAAMPTWETSPPIVQLVLILLCAHSNSDKFVLWRAFRGITPRNKIWSRSSYSILDNVCEERCQSKANKEAEDSDMEFVHPWLRNRGPEEENQ